MGKSKFDFLYFPACVNEKNSEYPTAHFRKMNRQEMKKCPAKFSLRAVPKIKKIITLFNKVRRHSDLPIVIAPPSYDE